MADFMTIPSVFALQIVEKCSFCVGGNYCRGKELLAGRSGEDPNEMRELCHMIDAVSHMDFTETGLEEANNAVTNCEQYYTS